MSIYIIRMSHIYKIRFNPDTNGWRCKLKAETPTEGATNAMAYYYDTEQLATLANVNVTVEEIDLYDEVLSSEDLVLFSTGA